MKRLLFPAILLLFSSLLKAQERRAISVNELSYLSLDRLWLNTDNAAALGDAAPNRAQVSLSGLSERGDFRLPYMPQSEQGIRLATEGYYRIGSWALYGNMKYAVASLDDLKWKYEIFASADNPFFFADSVAGHYDSETYSFDAGLAGSSPKGHWDYGLRVAYTTGSRGKNKDPRPLINGVRYSIRPGISYRHRNWRWGLALKAERYEEDVQVSVVEHLVVQHYFLFMGLGNFHPESGSEKSRDSKGENFGGSVQMSYEKGPWQNLLQLEYLSVKEYGNLGTALQPFKSGDYHSQRIQAGYLMKYRPNAGQSHLLTFNLSLQNDRGLWYNQKLDPLKFDPPEWIVYSQSIKWTKENYEALGSYRFIQEKDGRKALILGLSASLRQQTERIFPNREFMSFGNINLGAEAVKSFRLRSQIELLLDASLAWRKNLLQENNFGSIALREEISQPVFKFLTSDRIHSNISITFAKTFDFQQGYSLCPYLRASMSYNNAIREAQERSIYEIAWGLLF